MSIEQVIKGVVQPDAPTTAEKRLARKNELKTRGTLLMALPDKHQLKFNIHKDAKTLMEAIKKWFGGNKETKKRNKINLEEQSLDDLFNSLKIYEAKVKSSSSASTSTQNIAFVSSQNTNNTNEPVSDVASVFAASAKSNSPQLDNDHLKQIDADDLEEMDLKWQMVMLTVECYNCHRKGHFVRECRSPKDTRRNVQVESQRRSVPVETSTSNALVSQCDGLESIETRILVYQQNETIFEKDIKLLKLDVQRRDNALVVLRQKFEKAKQERDELKLKLEKFQTSSKNLSQLLASQTNDKTGLGYDNQVFTSSMFDCDEMFSFESDVSMPASPVYDRYQSGEGYHVVPPPYTGKFMPPKPDLVFHDAPHVNETVYTAFNVELSPTKPDKELSYTHRQSAPIIEDWVSDSKDESEAEPSQNDPSFVQPPEQVKNPRPSIKPVEHSIPAANHKTYIPNPKSHGNRKNRKACFVFTTTVPQPHVTRRRPAKTVVTKPYSPPRRNINRRPSLRPNNFLPKVITVKAPKANAVKGVQEIQVSYGLGNMSYLSDSKEINGGYVAFGGNPKGAKITSKGKIKTGKLDFDDVYFVKELKFNLFSISQMCDKKNSVLFTDTECIFLSFKFKLPDENQVLLRFPRDNNMYNMDLKNIVPFRDLTCLFAKATLDESTLWHRRLGHINFKIMNKLVKGNLVRGLPLKVFENNHTCVACRRASNIEPLVPWLFFLATKDETSPIRKTFINGIENQLSLKVKIIRSDNGTEFKNHDLNQFCKMKGIKREFSVPRTPQQNRIAERKNRTLIEAAKTMLADSLLPIPLWAESVNTAC
uniref:Uncharacterized protein n=1 Tax=Tanacetum cinerariifolium TaxID=118510 RepID=A0A699IWD6_TANCI|nr:hypothetical protein [Tanacetum cinerariifolium]